MATRTQALADLESSSTYPEESTQTLSPIRTTVSPSARQKNFLNFCKHWPQAAQTPRNRRLSRHSSEPTRAHLAFATTPKPAPVSFVTQSYFGVHAFRFINQKGASRFARYQIHPAGSESHLGDAEAAQRPANFLFDELHERLSHGPAELRLVAQLAGAGDPIDDASITWPADRPQVELGSIKVMKPVGDSEAAQRKLIFDPIGLVDGIELSNDPLPARAVSHLQHFVQSTESVADRLFFSRPPSIMVRIKRASAKLRKSR